MNVRNGIEALSQIFPSPPSNPGSAGKAEKDTNVGGLSADQAKVSAAASQASLSGSESEVRLEKVAAIQNAIQNGTYHVPASDVAAKVISSLLTFES